MSSPRQMNVVYAPRIDCIVKRQPTLQHFKLVGPLVFVDIDILDLLPKRRHENHVMIFMTDLYTKLMNEISMKQTTDTTAAKIFSKNWVLIYGI